jgi:NAD(P)-dependent dehydrogenase (short-subunit alcohol dehydrogenase family)
MLFAVSLAERLSDKGIQAFSVHPGREYIPVSLDLKNWK